MNRINERALGRSSYSFSLNSTTCSTSSTIPFLFISLLVPFQCNEKRTEEKGKENGRERR